MCPKWKSECGLWVLNEILLKKYAESLKKIVGAVWELPAKSTANPAKLGWKWAGLAVLFSRYLPNGSHDFFQTFSTDFYHYFIKNPQTTIALGF